MNHQIYLCSCCCLNQSQLNRHLKNHLTHQRVLMSEILELMLTVCFGGEVEVSKFFNAGLVVDFENDPLPEILLP